MSRYTLTTVIALVMVYDYHPNSITLFEAHVKAKAPQFRNGRLQAESNRVPERTLWIYIIQIASAIKAVHEAGLAVRVIDSTKILVTGKNRYSQIAVRENGGEIKIGSQMSYQFLWNRRYPHVRGAARYRDVAAGRLGHVRATHHGLVLQ